MRLLLDTHIAIWALYGQRELSQRAVDVLTDPEAERFVSAASIWEAAIKRQLDRRGFEVPSSFTEDLVAARMTLLPVTGRHAWSVQRLPLHHGDPFDRMLIAQALAENLTLLSRDGVMARYGAQLIPA